jgi:Mn2+/Fe2+ NRAMP family transporter
MPNNANPALHEPRACIGAPTTLRGRLRFIGPSLILTATLVGSGGLILTTTLGARVGFAALWVIILSCVLKVPLQESLGRYTISFGDTTLLATNRLPGPRFNVSWIVWFWLGGILLTTAQLRAIATLVGESLSMIPPALDGRRWAPIVCAVALLMLRNGHYQVAERFSTVMVACLSTLTILCAILIQWTPFALTGEQLLEGLRFRLPAAG